VAAQQVLPAQGTVLISLFSKELPAALEAARRFYDLGFNIKATRGTHRFLSKHGVKSELILKMHEGRPNIADGIKNKEIQLVINTPSGKLSKHDDSYIRKTSIKHKVTYITTLAAAVAAAKGIAAYRNGKLEVKSLQSYHADIA
jgi:carbamoyl-phosphate synthase large subunit